MLSKPKNNLGKKSPTHPPPPKEKNRYEQKNVTALESQPWGTSEKFGAWKGRRQVHEPSFEVNSRYLDKECTEVGSFLGDIPKKKILIARQNKTNLMIKPYSTSKLSWAARRIEVDAPIDLTDLSIQKIWPSNFRRFWFSALICWHPVHFGHLEWPFPSRLPHKPMEETVGLRWASKGRHTFRNPVNSPVEVGSLSHLFIGIYTF